MIILSKDCQKAKRQNNTKTKGIIVERHKGKERKRQKDDKTL